jgi:hypothetical protein
MENKNESKYTANVEQDFINRLLSGLIGMAGAVFIIVGVILITISQFGSSINPPYFSSSNSIYFNMTVDSQSSYNYYSFTLNYWVEDYGDFINIGSGSYYTTVSAEHIKDSVAYTSYIMGVRSSFYYDLQNRYFINLDQYYSYNNAVGWSYNNNEYILNAPKVIAYLQQLRAGFVEKGNAGAYIAAIDTEVMFWQSAWDAYEEEIARIDRRVDAAVTAITQNQNKVKQRYQEYKAEYAEYEQDVEKEEKKQNTMRIIGVIFIPLGALSLLLFCVPFAVIFRQKFITSHTVIDGKQLKFNGNFAQFLGK